MTIEDHVGDIISKGRQNAGVALDAAARAAGISTAELRTLEESGHAPKPLNYAALGALLGLDGRKLEGLANGWLPDQPDLGQWRELRVITTSDGGMAVHCQLVWDEVTRDAALFDTGWNAAPIFTLIEEHGLQLKHLFLTHTHSDHVAAVTSIRDRFPKARLHSSSKTAPPDQRNRPNDFISLGSLRITNRDTPGHSEESVTYIIGTWPEDAPHVAIVGDALFAGSMGRANFSVELARRKVKEQILSLPPETLICPGHGPLTTVAQEEAHNPFF
jgi:glyoxylase-like metal-dependent hydrolase (beta-lactamase superfamily II)